MSYFSVTSLNLPFIIELLATYFTPFPATTLVGGQFMARAFNNNHRANRSVINPSYSLFHIIFQPLTGQLYQVSLQTLLVQYWPHLSSPKHAAMPQHFPKWWHHHSPSCQAKIPTSLLPFLKKLYFTCYYYCQTDWILSKLAFSCVPHFEGIIQGHSLYARNYSDSSSSVCSQSFCLISSFFLFCCATSTCNNACILLMLT